MTGREVWTTQKYNPSGRTITLLMCKENGALFVYYVEQVKDGVEDKDGRTS